MIVYSFLPIVVIVVLTAVFALIGYTMKKGIVLQSLTCLLAVSCTVHEMETMTPVSAEDDVFYASMESYSAPDTRVYVDMGTLTSDGKFLTLWDAKDQISIFFFPGNRYLSAASFNLNSVVKSVFHKRLKHEF